MPPERKSRFEQDISPIAPRFAFIDPQIKRMDGLLYDLSDFRAVHRVIEYKKPTSEKAQVRRLVEDKGLLLGKPESSLHSPNSVSYIVPRGARPIAYDRASRVSGAYQYDDRDLFNDLGALLQQLTDLNAHGAYEMRGSIGMNVSKISFARPEDKKLLFVPGFEHYVEAVKDDQEALLQRYALKLYKEFGPRFEQNIDYFAQGFDRES